MPTEIHLRERGRRTRLEERNGYTREILVEVCEEHGVAALHDDGYSIKSEGRTDG